jgi:hypothetical protein
MQPEFRTSLLQTAYTLRHASQICFHYQAIARALSHASDMIGRSKKMFATSKKRELQKKLYFFLCWANEQGDRLRDVASEIALAWHERMEFLTSA